ATLPLSYRDKGIRECTFRIAFSDELDERLRFLRALGLTSIEPIEVRGKQPAKVIPQEVLLTLAARLPKVVWSGVPDEYEVLRTVVRGEKGGEAIEATVDCHTPGIPGWGMGVDVDTGCPPSIAVQLLARGAIDARGVLPPERSIPAKPFFEELKKRHMTVKR